MKQFLLSFLIAIIASCSDTGTLLLSEQDGRRVQVAFVLRLQNQQHTDATALSTSRATDKLGSDFETWIRQGSMQILIFTAAPAALHYVGKVEQLEYFPAAGTSESAAQEFHFRGISSVSLEIGVTYRFMVMANCGTDVPIPPSGEGPIFSLSDIAYQQGELPLWGMTSHTVDFRPVQYLETIRLMRGVAKVEVKLTRELREKGYRLDRVWLNHHAAQGYAFPKAWQTVGLTEELEGETQSYHPYPSVAASADLFRVTPDSTHYVAYLPEYDNLGNPAARISLTVSQGDQKEHYDEAIAFMHYQDGVAEEGTQHNIVRNHAYEFLIRQIQLGHPLFLESRVLPWTVEEESWDYTDHVSVRSEGKMQWVKGTYERIDPATGSVVMVPGVSMVCTFQIDTPEQARWYASFIPVSGASDAFRFETFSLQDGHQATGHVGEPVTLHIKSVQPAVDQNNVARLRIVVRTPDGRTLLVKNLLPDEFQEITEYTLVQSK